MSDRHKRKWNSNDRQSHGSSSSSQFNYKDDDAKRQKPSCSKSRSNDVSFLQFKSDLNRIFFSDGKLVDDIDDFWLFAKKFEAVQKRLNSSSTGDSEFDKNLLVNITLEHKEKEFLSRIPFYDESYGGPKITETFVKEFTFVVLSYLDFKQKEAFTKLRKLRKAQENLPVAQHREEILEAVANGNIVVIAGDTGCGKSTQVPQYLLKAGYSKIACTQPRRIACISLSKRVAFETLNKFGSEVGYQIRFEKNRMKETKIVFITEGILLRQIASDGMLSEYNIIVLDEVHERHLHGDFLLGVLKCLLQQRKDLKVILMSATININLFSDYFGGDAQVIQVPGRLYPIDINYMPVIEEDKLTKKEKINPTPYIRILQLIDEKYSNEERGDVLVFLSGMSEITSIVDAANQYNEKKRKWIILPLHSSLSLADQDKVFDYPPEGMRKCIVSTNIAETSITIDGIRFVVDSGMVKEMSYDPLCKMQRLKEFWISKASAEQRKGRAGRTGPGVCFRLYGEDDYDALQEFTTPEIQRVPLDSLLLQMIAMGLPDARKFPFIEPPPRDTIENAILSLKQHGALTEDEKLTSMGQMLSRLPVDIPLGKMLIMGSTFHQIEPTLSLAAALSVQNPFTNRSYRDPECETSRKSLESDHGDPITLLNAFKEWLEIKNENSHHDRGSSRKWSKRAGLEEQRFYEMVKLRSQFKDLLKDCGLLKMNSRLPEKMTSSERALRHGEVKLLKNLKRSHDLQSNKKKRVLKPDTWQIENENEVGTDIRDVDFRLSNNQTQLQSLLTGSIACTYKDLTMLKVILSSGLYPQISIPDEFNHCKGIKDQLFHTKGKPFVFLHPLSFFGNHADVLQLCENDIVDTLGSSSRKPLSSKHQLLCYMSLLETSKPYLVNTLRMPVAQTLLLFSNCIQTSSDFSKVFIDSWIQLTFPAPPPAEKLVLKAVSLRSKWELLLKLRLEENDSEQLENDLVNGLVGLMNTEIVYFMKRLLPADLKNIYSGPNSYSIEGINPVLTDYPITVNEEIGGVRITPYLTYNCLIEEDLNTETWECPHCGLFAPLIALERLQHLRICKNEDTIEDEPSIEKEDTVKKPNSKSYHCNICDKKLILTPIEILRHKKSHS